MAISMSSARRVKNEYGDDAETNPDVNPYTIYKITKKECAICCEDKAPNQLPKLPHVGAQKHDHNTCRKCWNSHLKTEVESKKGFDRIGCPECKQLLQKPEVRKLARKSTYSTFVCLNIHSRRSELT
jgi:hypothetical protein